MITMRKNIQRTCTLFDKNGEFVIEAAYFFGHWASNNVSNILEVIQNQKCVCTKMNGFLLKCRFSLETPGFNQQNKWHLSRCITLQSLFKSSCIRSYITLLHCH